MMNVLMTESKPVKLWLDDLEEGALQQAKNLANFPFTFKHVALMADCHQGFGMPIGGVVATKGVVSPNMVGVDIGCGMCAVKTSLKDISKEDLKSILSEIRKVIPVGFNKHEDMQSEALLPKVGTHLFKGSVVEDHFKNALKSIGTLGGGNHFIEIQKGDDGHIWIMIHSGSRNLGKQVADHYNKIAKDLNKKWGSSVDPKHDLAFLPLESEEGKKYLREMQYCVDFALINRKTMMKRIGEIFSAKFNRFFYIDKYGERMDAVENAIINIAHNYASLENHYGENVVVHRKGATLARKGTIGIIPGSQGTSSYIVEGLGNKESFESCSHGAGRKMGRNYAQRTLDFETEKKALDDMGVLHAMRGVNDLDEAPGAYKDIKDVMKNQEDLVKIIVELTPLAVVKG